jgi:hypothetical protein
MDKENKKNIKNMVVSESGAIVNNSRLFNVREIDMLLNLSLSADTNWEIIIGTLNEKMIFLIRDLFMDDPQVKIKSYTNGCDLLVGVVKELPDLVIIDEKLPGIPFKELVGCIKRTEFLNDVKIFCNLSSTSSVIERGCEVDDFITLENLDKIYISRKLNSLLYKSTTHHDKRIEPKSERKWPRINLNIGARIEVLDPFDAVRYDYGNAKIENISREGAYITQIRLKNGFFPSGVFHVRLQVNQTPLKDWKADSLVIRANENDSVGLKFVNISRENKDKIMDYFE